MGKVPKVKAYGKLMYIDEFEGLNEFYDELKTTDTQKSKIFSYLIMPRYSMTLQTLVEKHKLSKESVYSLGIQLLNIFEQIHAEGFVYNDLKLDNLMVEHDFDTSQLKNERVDIFKKNSINIVDFGFASNFREKKTSQSDSDNQTLT